MPPEPPPGPAAVQSKIGNPKSKIRLHLSTCIILLFASGALLGANMYPQAKPVYLMTKKGARPVLDPAGARTIYGWPFVCKLILNNRHQAIEEWHYDNLSFNLLAAAAILTTIAWLCELRIRRWEKHRDAPP